jgi:hypothetical protein
MVYGLPIKNGGSFHGYVKQPDGNMIKSPSINGPFATAKLSITITNMVIVAPYFLGDTQRPSRPDQPKGQHAIAFLRQSGNVGRRPIVGEDHQWLQIQFLAT